MQLDPRNSRPPTPAQAPARPAPAPAAEARRALEAMRLGVVSAAAVDAISVGRARELDRVDADLAAADDAGGAVRAFLGHYGTGKTHMLELVGQRALDRGFLVARVVLNPDETSPSHPKRVYRALVRSLAYPDRTDGQADGLRPLLVRALDTDAALEAFAATERDGRPRALLDQGAHLYLTPALRYLAALRRTAADTGGLDPQDIDELVSLLVDWLEGHPTISNTEIDDQLRRAVGRQGRIYCMKDFRPWARIYAYLLSGIAALARRVGYRGLVLLIDEAEFFDLLSADNQDYARTLFKALSWASIGDADGRMPFDRAELDLGGYGIQQDLPARYDAAPGLYTVFAMTPQTEGVEALRGALPADALWELHRLETDDYRQLVSRVVAHARRARPDHRLGDEVADALAKLCAGLLAGGYVDNPRQAMKFVVEFLDLHYHRPEALGRVVGDLRQMYLAPGGR